MNSFFDEGFAAGLLGLPVEANPYSALDVEAFTLWDCGHAAGELEAINLLLAAIAVEVLEVELAIVVF